MQCISSLLALFDSQGWLLANAGADLMAIQCAITLDSTEDRVKNQVLHWIRNKPGSMAQPWFIPRHSFAAMRGVGGCLMNQGKSVTPFLRGPVRAVHGTRHEMFGRVRSICGVDVPLE